MFTSNDQPRQHLPERPRRRGPGRPRGRTPQSDATRAELYRAAIGLIAERGYEEATLREIAARARVSPGLLYRYFPSKRAVVLALYDELSLAFVERAGAMPRGKWRDRAVFALRTSLDVLAPHRAALSALTPVLVGGRDEGLLAPATAFSRERVQRVFVDAVADARDAPRAESAAALGRVLYLVHLGVILWWLLDRSDGQRATARLVALIEKSLAPFSLALKLRPVRGLVGDLDALAQQSLFGA